MNLRYRNDGVSVLPLNAIQKEYIEVVKEKLTEGIYRMETVPCAICEDTEFIPVAGKDRYGFSLDFVVCKTCGLAQTNPRMDQASYFQFYDSEYRFIYGGETGPTQSFFDDQYHRLGKKIYSFIEENTGAIRNKFVLEVGCGAGGILKYFSDRGCTVKGIDLGKQFVQYGKDVHGLDLDVMPVDQLRLEQKPDIIIYSHVLEHILDLRAQLRRISTLMHSNTLLYVEVPGLKYLHKSYNMDLLLYLQNAHVYHFTELTLSNLMSINGFSCITNNEHVQSIFKRTTVAQPKYALKNEYRSVQTYLKRVETVRKWSPFPLYKSGFFLKRIAYKFLSSIKVLPKKY